MQFDIISTAAWFALSLDTATAVKGRKSSKSQKPIIEKCSQVLYNDVNESDANFQFYPAGPPALGNQLCGPEIRPGLTFCSGDRCKHIIFFAHTPHYLSIN